MIREYLEEIISLKLKTQTQINNKIYLFEYSKFSQNLFFIVKSRKQANKCILNRYCKYVTPEKTL